MFSRVKVGQAAGTVGTDPISSHAANQAALARAAGGDATEQRRHREIRGAIFGSI